VIPRMGYVPTEEEKRVERKPKDRSVVVVLMMLESVDECRSEIARQTSKEKEEGRGKEREGDGEKGSDSSPRLCQAAGGFPSSLFLFDVVHIFSTLLPSRPSNLGTGRCLRFSLFLSIAKQSKRVS